MTDPTFKLSSMDRLGCHDCTASDPHSAAKVVCDCLLRAAAACRAFLRLFINKMDDSTRAANYEMLVGMGQAAAIQEWVVDTVQDMQAGRQ